MDMEAQVTEVIVLELQRQAENTENLKVGTEKDGVLSVEGPVNLDELAMAVVGHLAGGP